MKPRAHRIKRQRSKREAVNSWYVVPVVESVEDRDSEPPPQRVPERKPLPTRRRILRCQRY
jgi:hypothetical protein